MDSYLKSKLAQAKAKVASAAKYLPKDIMKNMPGRERQEASNEGSGNIEDDFVEVDGI
jgi:hypothetical protein